MTKKNIVLSRYYFFAEKISFFFFDFMTDPDPLYPEVDPRIRIHSKMKWIRNTGKRGSGILISERRAAWKKWVVLPYVKTKVFLFLQRLKIF